MLIEQAGVDRNAMKDWVVVITGAGEGVGKQAARIMAHLGANVVLAEVREEVGRDVEREINDAGGRAIFVPTDVSNPDDVDRLRQQVLDRFGRVDVLVNNAALHVKKTLLDTTLDDWQRVLDTNLRGAFLCIQAFLPGMTERENGTIVTFESGQGALYSASYLAAKAGVCSLALALSEELAEVEGVWSYCFSPGLVDTSGSQRILYELAPEYRQTVDDLVAASGDELVSTELVATGLVGTILHAEDYDGEQVNYLEGLELLGITLEKPSVDGLVASALQQALALNHRLEDILRTSIKEYDWLPRFERPAARKAFQQRLGVTPEEYLASAERMTALIQGSLAGDVNLGDDERKRIQEYISRLRNFAAFQARREVNARRWIKDPGQVQAAVRTLESRHDVASDLTKALTAIAEKV